MIFAPYELALQSMRLGKKDENLIDKSLYMVDTT